MAYEELNAANGNLLRRLPRVQVLLAKVFNQNCYVLYTNDPRIKKFVFTDTSILTEEWLLRHVDVYIDHIVRGGYATADLIDPPPQVAWKYAAADKWRIAAAQQMQQMQMEEMKRQQERLERRKQPCPFEVNLVEPLVGWKGWRMQALNSSLPPILCSPSQGTHWLPNGKPFGATCESGCGEIVHEECGCGIYATDSFEHARGYGEFHGEVYGWGRYVRGEKGWRAQFVYPKNFHLPRSHAHLVEHLKAFHVPIYVIEPVLLYNPEEDGYGYGQENADGDSRTTQDSDAGQAGS